jgi:hypothetical protein
MFTHFKTSAAAAIGLTLLSGAGGGYAASHVSNFGPPVSGDQSLNTSLGKLAQTIAWQNSPEGDIYQLALATPAPEMPFENVAMEFGSEHLAVANSNVYDDKSLNGSLDALTQVIAWRKSPEGDAFQYALRETVKAADFKRVALASIPSGGFDANF